jgi:hypothetical protein
MIKDTQIMFENKFNKELSDFRKDIHAGPVKFIDDNMHMSFKNGSKCCFAGRIVIRPNEDNVTFNMSIYHHGGGFIKRINQIEYSDIVKTIKENI